MSQSSSVVVSGSNRVSSAKFLQHKHSSSDAMGHTPGTFSSSVFVDSVTCLVLTACFHLRKDLHESEGAQLTANKELLQLRDKLDKAKRDR